MDRYLKIYRNGQVVLACTKWVGKSRAHMPGLSVQKFSFCPIQNLKKTDFSFLKKMIKSKIILQIYQINQVKHTYIAIFSFLLNRNSSYQTHKNRSF